MKLRELSIKELAVIGDRHTAALVASDASIVWYCPERFNKTLLLAALLDRAKCGSWAVNFPGAECDGRCHLEDSAILEARLTEEHGALTVTDWMSLADGLPKEICRLFSRGQRKVGSRDQQTDDQQAVYISLTPAPDYGRDAGLVRTIPGGLCINEAQWFHASGPVRIEPGSILFEVAQRE